MSKPSRCPQREAIKEQRRKKKQQEKALRARQLSEGLLPRTEAGESAGLESMIPAASKRLGGFREVGKTTPQPLGPEILPVVLDGETTLASTLLGGDLTVKVVSNEADALQNMNVELFTDQSSCIHTVDFRIPRCI